MSSWKESDEVVKQMCKGSNGSLWGHKLEHADHFPILKSLLEKANNTGLLIDIGCGAGDVSRVWKGDYLGIDLDWVIEKVAKVCNPSFNFVMIDVLNDDLSEIPSCNCLLMNAFLDMIEEPITVLRKIIKSIDANYVIVHRQKITATPHKELDFVTSYAGTVVPASKITKNSIEQFCQEMNVKDTMIIHWSGEYYSFIMRLK